MPNTRRPFRLAFAPATVKSHGCHQFDRLASPVKILALAAIAFYRRVLSPWKGFSCAYRVHTGHASCSALGFRAVRKYGARRGLDVLHERLKRCGDAYRQYRTSKHFREAGHCDVPCHGDIPDVSCDHGEWDCLSSLGDAASCFDSPCDGGSLRGLKRAPKESGSTTVDAKRG